jgi:DNA-binding transcriptional ArsR family regulator
MIRIEVDEATLGRTRLSTSPLMELASSLFLLARRQVPWPYEEWAVGARDVLTHDGRTAPLQVFRELDGGFPDFLNPPPRPGVNALADELARLRATPVGEMHRQLDHYYGEQVPAVLKPYRRDPEIALAGLVDAFAAYWEGAMEPIWSTMRTLIDGEVLRRAKAMAQAGPDSLLEDLHPRIRWRRPVLELVKRTDLTLGAGERRLQLVPQVFAADGVIVGEYDAELFTLTFQVRGAAALTRRRDRSGDGGDDRLGLLLGRSRAAILRELAGPLTTQGLADRLGVAPSTVSEHLSVLVAAGVVHRHRIGRRVYYQVTDPGRSLLGLLGKANVDAQSA